MDITLYYYTRAEYLPDIIRNNRLRVTDPLKSNDPLELNPVFIPEESDSDNEQLLTFQLGEGYKHAIKQHSPAIVCLSANMSSMLMWGHYASSHSGVCLAFKFELEDNSFSIKLRGTGSADLIPVVYCKKRINGRNFIVKQDENSVPIFKMFPLFQRLMCCKWKDWSYEREMRLLLGSSVPLSYEGGYLFTPCLMRHLDGIIIGLKSKLSIRDIEALCFQTQHEGIKIAHADLDRKECKISTDCYKDMLDEDYNQLVSARISNMEDNEKANGVIIDNMQ